MSNKLIFFLLPTALILDILAETVFEVNSTLSYIKATIYYLIIIYSIIVGFFRKDSVNMIILPIFIFTIVQVPFSENPLESLRMSLKVFMPIMTFVIGYYFINSHKKLGILNSSIVLLMIIYIINFIISQVFGLGFSQYTNEKDFLVGNLNDSWNNITYMLLVVPALYLTIKNKRLLLVLSLILIFLLLFSLKRIAILGVFIGYLIYLFKSGRFIQSSKYLTIILIIFSVFITVIGDNFFKRIEARGDKINVDAISVVERETRFAETILVMQNTFSFRNIKESLIGVDTFYTIGNYGGKSFGDRQIHVDYNLILHSIGIIGFLMYLNIFKQIYKLRKNIKHFILKRNDLRQLDHVFIMLFVTQFFTSLGGQMYSFVFRAIIFIYLGSILGYAYRLRKNEFFHYLNNKYAKHNVEKIPIKK